MRPQVGEHRCEKGRNGEEGGSPYQDRYQRRQMPGCFFVDIYELYFYDNVRGGGLWRTGYW